MKKATSPSLQHHSFIQPPASLAGINTTDPDVTLDGFYMDLMMNRGSDPAKSKSTLGADHLAVKEVNTSSQVAGHHTVIASIEEEGDPRIVWW